MCNHWLCHGIQRVQAIVVQQATALPVLHSSFFIVLCNTYQENKPQAKGFQMQLHQSTVQGTTKADMNFVLKHSVDRLT